MSIIAVFLLIFDCCDKKSFVSLAVNDKSRLYQTVIICWRKAHNRQQNAIQAVFQPVKPN